jgi:hypothetical protein
MTKKELRESAKRFEAQEKLAPWKRLNQTWKRKRYGRKK